MLVLALVLTFFLNAQTVPPGQIELSSDGNIIGRKSAAYCGIYAAYGAASAVLKKSGQKPAVEFPALLSHEFVSSNRGSSTRDLLSAVEKLGCKGKAYQCLSVRSLEASTCPLILHVSGRGAMGTYQHWVLFLGVDSENAILQDGEGGSFPMSMSELLSRWDGKAIAVFPKDLEPPIFHSWEILINCILLGGLGFMIQIARSLAPNCSLKSQSMIFVLLLNVSVLYCFLVIPHVTIERNTAHAVKIHTDPGTVELLTFEDLQHRLSIGDVTLVDCRYSKDFEYGAIEHAISVPVDVSQNKLLSITKKLPRESSIVLYCQSSGCHFSNVIAVEFAKLGFTKLSIYKNGYAEWETKSE